MFVCDCPESGDASGSRRCDHVASAAATATGVSETDISFPIHARTHTATRTRMDRLPSSGSHPSRHPATGMRPTTRSAATRARSSPDSRRPYDRVVPIHSFSFHATMRHSHWSLSLLVLPPPPLRARDVIPRLAKRSQPPVDPPSLSASERPTTARSLPLPTSLLFCSTHIHPAAARCRPPAPPPLPSARCRARQSPPKKILQPMTP
jgi:hypothetical protein